MNSQMKLNADTCVLFFRDPLIVDMIKMIGDMEHVSILTFLLNQIHKVESSIEIVNTENVVTEILKEVEKCNQISNLVDDKNCMGLCGEFIGYNKINLDEMGYLLSTFSVLANHQFSEKKSAIKEEAKMPDSQLGELNEAVISINQKLEQDPVSFSMTQKSEKTPEDFSRVQRSIKNQEFSPLKELKQDLSLYIPSSSETQEDSLSREIFEMSGLWNTEFIIPPQNEYSQFIINPKIDIVKGEIWNLQGVDYTRWGEYFETQSIISSVIVFIMALKLTF